MLVFCHEWSLSKGPTLLTPKVKDDLISTQFITVLKSDIPNHSFYNR